MKKLLLLYLLSFVAILASAQFTYDFNKETGVLTIGGNGTTVTAKDVNKAVGRTSSDDDDYTLKEVVFTASNVTTIEDEAFSSFSALKGITLPETLKSIGNSTFIYCSSLSSITLPESLTTIGEDAFIGCNALTNITVSTKNNHFASVDGVLFNKQKTALIIYPVAKQDTSYSVPENTKNIEKYAFMDCSALTSITLPDAVTTIGENAFADCSALTSINLPNSITTVEKRAFSGCSSLTSITLPNALTAIEKGVFSHCSSLTKITLPDALTTINEDAFEGCDSLTNIIFPDGLVTIRAAAFEGCSSLKTITLPAALKKFSNLAFCGCSSLTNITISTQNNYFSSVDGVLFNKQKTTLIIYPIGKNQTSYTVPENIDSIGSDAFSYSSLRNIIFPESLEKIGESAFSDCLSLTDITCLSKTEPEFGSNVFEQASKTRTVYVPNATSGFSEANWGTESTTVTIKYGEYPTSIKESTATSEFTTEITNGKLLIQGLKQGTTYTVTNTNGSLIAKGIATQNSCHVNLTGHGICIVHAAGTSKKIIY